MKKIIFCLSLSLFSINLFATEQINFSQPRWKLLSEEKNTDQIMQIYEPEKQLSSEIEERLFIQTLIGKTDSDAQTWLEKLRAERKAECNFFSFIEIPVKGADPSPAAGQVLYCGQEIESGQGVISMHRVTQGTENLYVIEKRWTTYPFDHPENAFVVREELMPWIRKMARAFVIQQETSPGDKK